MPHPALTSGQTAVISGAASGIGLAAAKAMAARGMAVVLLDLPGDRLTAAAQQITDLGTPAMAIGLDVADAAAYAKAASSVAASLCRWSESLSIATIARPRSAASLLTTSSAQPGCSRTKRSLDESGGAQTITGNPAIE